jgi:hypothetical protein
MSQLNAVVLRSLARVVSLVSIPLAFRIERMIPRPRAQISFPDGPMTDEDLLWLQKAEQARISELETIRAAAKDWASTIAAVTGAVGVVSLVKGPDQIDTLTRAWKQAVGVAAAIAVVSALRGIYLAALAAQGSPRSFGYNPATFRRRYRLETLSAARALEVSRALIVIATLAAACATGMLWFGTAKQVPSARVVAVTADGTTACGVLSVAQSGAITITADGGGVTSIDPVKLRRLIPTGTCP